MIILFDLDGTLIDSTEAIVSTFHHSFDVHNSAHPKDSEIEELIGYPLEIMYAKLGVEEEKVWDFVATYKKRYREISTLKTELLDCTRDTLKIASSFATLGIVTTKTGLFSKILMEHFNLYDYFDILIGREDVTNPKPDKEPIEKALKALNMEDKDIWMIGDTKLDLLCAKNANVNSIAVLTGYGTKEELQNYTNFVFEDALKAIEFLKNRKK